MNATRFSLLLLAVLLSACATPNAPVMESQRADNVPAHALVGDGPGNYRRAARSLEPEVRDEPKSRSGNAAEYTVFGRQYRVLDSAEGYRADGVASWYGRKFHGRPTASGEAYDMHEFTAAHRHLPLPTFVRVTRTDTGQSVVVRVNDRGPFVDDRLIDLSYAAAMRLDMLGKGTAPVRVEALSRHLTDKPVMVTSAPAEPKRPTPLASASTVPPAERLPTGAYLQLGAFRDADNAESLLARIGSLPVPLRITHDARDALFRVQAGPISEVGLEQATLAVLDERGIAEYALVHH